MPGNKQITRYRRKRTGVFTGKRKQDVLFEEIVGGHVALGHTTSSDAALAHSPPKKNRSKEKINEICPLIIKQNEAVVTRRKALDLGKHSQGKTTVQSYGNHVVSSSCLEEGFLSAVVCASCRSPKGKLVLMQDESKRIGLHETFTLPSPVSSKAYNATVKEIQMSVDKECQKSLKSAVPNTSGADKAWTHWKRTFNGFISSIDTTAQTVNKLHILVNYISHDFYEYISECIDFESAMVVL